MIDAHNHLHDARLAPHRAAAFAELAALGVERAVVNGTRADDWPAVTALAAEHACVWPSFGLHPWHVATRPADWLEKLRALLVAHPRAGVGEIGLDRWIKGHDPAAQAQVFTAQLALAVELDRVPTIHCLRAWGALWATLRAQPVPARGFLLHAYGGPAELAAGLAARGAYFSFSPYFLHARKAAQREIFRTLPAERLLVETDAPDLAPPDAANPRPLPGGLNHPGNLDLAYAALAGLRGWPRAELAARVAENFARLFG
jgi:TatD DNase family protein